MHRGQATIEYVLLITALMLGMCVLVRFPTPVEWMARAIAHAVSHRPSGPGHHGGGRHHGSPHRRPHPCACPTGTPRSTLDGSFLIPARLAAT